MRKQSDTGISGALVEGGLDEGPEHRVDSHVALLWVPLHV